MTTAIPYRQIRAVFSESTVRVYQAYSETIADRAPLPLPPEIARRARCTLGEPPRSE